MNKLLSILVLAVLIFFTACDREIEEGQVDLGYDFQPLEIGLFWIYEVDQTTHFGENDSEQTLFFYKDRIRSIYTNEEGEAVYIVQRSKSSTNSAWSNVLEYTLIQRDRGLVRTIENQPLVSLVFPPKNGVVWNGYIYRNGSEDEFELISSGNSIRVNQEESDDLVTYRDIRYEVYEKGVGLTEKYDEVLTYCSRNDCLGDMLIDSGFKIHMKLIENGKN
ncbi:hypothetical protein [Algoriphagus aquimarinus]|uniref:Uncharacterized protein n=1 Tax=Algoriphagus aquimarinus TaxID=237018 RepID=A0A1I1AFM0_9BACT|nr:hypothetical protein [Algoriphagus aquimarinus]SFB36825.1 hypothetical protein SAMN04489723_10894 [Algoriphagus aquimarinus]|tara:strand:+ start:62374 stop:63033 length:660 start_codon:yes stop_codon:yes gene_type:complete